MFFEERLNEFWKKNQTIVIGLCVLVLAAILGKGLWERYEKSQERDVEMAYDAATSPEQLRTFVAAHPDHPLAAVAEVRLADEAYSAGKPADAIADYEKAQSILKSGPLATRAQLGHALAEVQAGRASEATSELKQIFNDTTQFKAARAEAGYQLASLAADAGNAPEVQKDLDQLLQVDPSGPWTQRAMMLRATLPAPAPMGLPATSAPALAPSGSSAAAGPNVEVKIPGK